MPLPALEPDTKVYWEACRAGRLAMLRCRACRWIVHPPRPVCSRCRSRDVALEDLSGRATLHTYPVNHQAWMPGLPVPFVIARVRLDGVPDVVLTTNIVNCDPDSVDFDDRVAVTFDAQDGIWFPVFEKVG